MSMFEEYNVFADEAVDEVIEFMAFPEEEVTMGEAMFHWTDMPWGRLDSYLNVEFRAEPLRVPKYSLPDGLWMSITPMEVQSAYVAINRSDIHGLIGCGGLGMGFVPMAMAKRNPDAMIDVYELNGDCIKLFEKLHGHRPEAQQLNIIHGDVRDEMQNMSYDYVFMDIYQSLMDSEVLDDIHHFMSGNDIGEYRWWGQEAAIVAQDEWWIEESIDFLREYNIWTRDDGQLVSMHRESEGSRLVMPSYPTDYCLECIEAMQEEYLKKERAA